jgi:TonB family protein
MILVDDSRLAFSLVASCLIHVVVVIVAPMSFRNDSNRRHRDLIPVRLLELSPVKQETPLRPEIKPDPVKKPLPPPVKPKLPKPETPEPVANKPPAQQAAPPQVISPPIEQAVKSPESHTPLPADPMPQNSTAPADGNGSAVGAGNLFGKGESGVIPGPEIGGAGETASLGSGQASGTTGPPAPTTPVRTGREAKPMQTVRATYPPMALRMGLESDVTLRITIDSKGTVIDTEIIKSGGAGFDDEALKAVKQARFEPAQNDGKNVPAEFTYVYRFRLRR